MVHRPPGDHRLTMSVPIDAQLGGYRLDAEIGRGGMGVVYRATELALDRPVALKLVAPELAGDAEFRERFLRESRLAASLDHPGLLPVYAAGEADGQLFLATRFVDGTDLRTLLGQTGPLDPERALGLVGQVADALDAAHGRGLVHRDVKPGNVLVDERDHCYLCDFGLTTRLGDTGATGSGRLMGSLDYLAPEQIRQEDVDGRADQYALACVLFECLEGSTPFRRATEAQTLWAHLQEEPPPLPRLPELDPVLRRGLAKEPADRYESCDAFVEAAHSVLGLAPSPAARRRRRRRVGGRLMLAGAVLVAAAAVAAAWLAFGTGGSLVAEANSVAAIDPATHEIVATIPVGDAPTAIAASDDWVWVVNSNDGVGTISRLDARTSRPVSTFSVLGTPSDLLFAAGSLWVGTSEGRVSRIEPSSDVEEERWTLRNAGRRSAFVDDPGAGFLAYGAGTVWASTLQTLTRIAPATSQTTPLTSPGRDDFDVGLGSVWIGGTSGLLRLAARTLRRQAMVPLPFAVTDASVGAGSVWLPDAEGRRVWRVDAATNVVVRTYDLGGRGSSVAVGAGAVWAASDDGTVLRIDPATGAAERIHVGGAPIAVAVGADRVWVSVG